MPECPAENAPIRLRAGDFLGEIKIVKWLATLPAATLYHAQQSETAVLLKVAHHTHEDKLKREALFLQNHTHPALPHLLPAHSDTSLITHPYGKSAHRGQILTYILFEESQAQPLREILLRNPQPWYRLTGWLMVNLADVLGYLHDCGLYHLSLSPDLLLVRFDNQNVPRPLLVDLGVAAAYEDTTRYWRPQYVPTGYIAPEIRQRQPVSESTDVYGLGLMLYELLAGQPAYLLEQPGRLVPEKALAQRVGQPVERPDLSGLPQLAEWATREEKKDRPSNILIFANELLAHMPPVPAEKQRKTVGNYIFWVATLLAVLFSIMLLIALLMGIDQ
jgi:serine/threonine protein kinase